MTDSEDTPEQTKLPQTATTLTHAQLHETISRLEKILIDRPNDMKVVNNLLMLLDCQIPKTSGRGAYSMCQIALSSQFKKNGGSESHLETDFLINSINDYRKIISQFDINRRLPVQQIYEGTRHEINEQAVYCGKYLDFFSKTQVICGICYDCYKVQIAPANLIDLFRLCIILKVIKLDRDNTRKCMIEVREAVDKPYKGYIYCQSEEEAINCLHTLKLNFERFGLNHIICGISHGCSEYGLKYPEFKFSHDGTHRSQKQSDSWKKIESDFFSEPVSDDGQVLEFNTHEITLRDMICFETWIKYSEMIGDRSHKHFAPVPPSGKSKRFVDRVERQAHMRKTQLFELKQQQKG